VIARVNGLLTLQDEAACAMARNPIMMPWMPQLNLWGSPLYNELYVGLCRALAAPWLGVRPTTDTDAMRTERGAGKPGEGKTLASAKGWQLLDSRQFEGHPIGASSLAELCRTVRGTRDQNGISSSRSS
jgi:hypothetical protein